MRTRAYPLIIALLFSAPALAQQAAAPIGHIQNMAGAVTVQRGGSTLPGVAGMPLLLGDHVLTGKPGSAGIVLTDDTTISLGSASALALDDYAFDPNKGKFALAMKMVKGTFSYITGQIGKLAPDTVKVRTPDATIATRGTKLLVEVKE
jgi:hypothetical protein